MAATADYLNKLVAQKNTLADYLVTKGVTASHDETLETLVPKVLTISEDGNTQKYITDGLIVYSDLSDIYGYNIVFDETLGRNVNYCNNSADGYKKVSNNDLVSQLSSSFTLQVLAKTTQTSTSETIIFGCIYDEQYRTACISICNGYFSLERSYGHFSTDILINDNKWHMLTAAYDGTSMKLYCDGNMVYEDTNTWNIPSNAVICIGQWQTGASKFNGYMADACIYNRALSSEEVVYNYSKIITT